ncbi:Similar to S.cerevisiae protein MID1 (N-glycosylated integral membrane protein of the ER and plasma membrane) [Malassezia sympodialis ATCC 42132]|uniref:Similar to S.cerevisiae protein MID1 (N-glycosylated integral membrane protein of the ER and plasma membrane) n=1 Tax=Malassezia sympodialis (strain ATCC 42132) TaxID=1230383 RepID=A0A1M8A1B0_MALS4|nr:Similar to S.cerevisiae protein MID1 (N-glycosylated integral membrane protein of the ER and plasma membrane) [Malassezia sympodialis ATCC 42132]
MHAWLRVAVLGACAAMLCAAAASSSSSTQTSSLVTTNAGPSRTNFHLPTHSTASGVSANTGIAPPLTGSAVPATDGQPYMLKDSVTVRSYLQVGPGAPAPLYYTFARGAGQPVWVSMSLCNGPGIPAYNTSNATLLDDMDTSAKDLRESTLVGLFVSDRADAQRPGPRSGLSADHVGYAQGGWTQVALQKGAAQDVWIGIWPPRDPRGAQGRYEVQLTASTVGSLQDVAAVPGLYFDDSDRRSALLTSFNYTAPPPNMSLIVLPTDGRFSLTSITYFNSSFCRIFDLWDDMDQANVRPAVNSSETSRGTLDVLTRIAGGSGPENHGHINDTAGIAPIIDNDLAAPVMLADETRSSPQVRKQFLVNGLEPGQNYTAYLVSSTNNSGVVHRRLYPAVKFVTKRTENCRLMYNLAFCPELAYAVPYNPALDVNEALRVLEQVVSSNYGNFSATLDTFPCADDKLGRYSSVSTCEDCRRAYQNWLCAVAIPRCTDLVDPAESAASQNGTELQGLPMPPNERLLPYIVNRVGPRSSRQAYIDQLFGAGDYGELLPCLLTCEMVTRSCPPVLRWACPRWTVTAQRDYGTFADADDTGFGVNENGGGGPGGLRWGGAWSRYVAQDAFGHVYCNPMDVDRLLRQASGAAPRGPPLWTAALAALATILAVR